MALSLLKHGHFEQDAQGRPVQLHYLRAKDHTELDFALSNGQQLTHMIECKWPDTQPSHAFASFGAQWPDAKRVQLVRHLQRPEYFKGVDVINAPAYLLGLSA